MNNPFQTDAHTMDLDGTEVTVEEARPEQGLELHVGSNVFRSTNGVIKLQGKEQIVLEVQPQSSLLFVPRLADFHCSDSLTNW